MHAVYFYVLLLYYLVLALGSKALMSELIFDVMGDADMGYFISVSIGTPPQTAVLLIDSGSSNLGISVDFNLTSYSFDYKKSKTFHGSDTTVTMKYTKGKWSGFLATDTFRLCPDLICEISLEFACITSSADFFEDFADWSGILGLAFPSLAEPKDAAHPFLESLMANGIPNVFSISLCGPNVRSNLSSTAEGRLLFGTVNTDYYEGDILFTPVVKEWFYEVVLTDLKVGNSRFNSSCTDLNNDKTVVDTGSSFLHVPKKIQNWIVTEIKQQVPVLEANFPENFWTRGKRICMKDEHIYKLFPKITLSFYHTANTSFSIVISPELYISKSASIIDEFCLQFTIQPSKNGTVIGATVLKGFYVVFDRENKRVGFANSSCSENIYTSSNLRSTVLKPQFTKEDGIQCRVFLPEEEENENILIFALIITIIIFTPALYVIIKWLYYFIVKLETRSLLF